MKNIIKQEGILLEKMERKLFFEKIEKQYQNLKNAPIEEYFSRILDIVKQLRKNWVDI